MIVSVGLFSQGEYLWEKWKSYFSSFTIFPRFPNSFTLSYVMVWIWSDIILNKFLIVFFSVSHYSLNHLIMTYFKQRRYFMFYSQRVLAVVFQLCISFMTVGKVWSQQSTSNFLTNSLWVASLLRCQHLRVEFKV